MITLKEFSQLISEFINNNFVPLLQAHNAEHNRLLDTWKSVSRMLTDIEKVDY